MRELTLAANAPRVLQTDRQKDRDDTNNLPAIPKGEGSAPQHLPWTLLELRQRRCCCAEVRPRADQRAESAYEN